MTTQKNIATLVSMRDIEKVRKKVCVPQTQFLCKKNTQNITIAIDILRCSRNTISKHCLVLSEKGKLLRSKTSNDRAEKTQLISMCLYLLLSINYYSYSKPRIRDPALTSHHDQD